MRRKRRSELARLIQRLHKSRGWVLLAVCQLLILLTLLLTWTVTLTLVVPTPEAPLWSELVQEFHRQHPRIRIQLVPGDYTTDELEAIYTSNFASGNSAYDVIYTDTIWVPKFAASGWLKDLSSFVSPQSLEAFVSSDVEAGRYQQNLYRIPFRLDAGVLFYNKRLLAAQSSPPTTFDQLVDRAQQAQQGNAEWGYLWQGQRYEGLVAVFLEVLTGHGGFWIDTTTEAVGLDQPAAIAAAQFLQRSIGTISPPAVTTYTDLESFAEFEQGRTAFLRSWPFYWVKLQQLDALRDSVGLAPLMSISGQPGTACKGGWGFSMTYNAKHPRQAWQVIQFFTSEFAQRRLLEQGYLPSLRSLYRDAALIQQHPYLPLLFEIVQTAVPRPAITQYDQASEILQQHLSAVLAQPFDSERGRQIAETELKAAAIETRRLLSD